MSNPVGVKRPRSTDDEISDPLQVPRRRRREKYTRAACASCKTRKVKCSGESPCTRCSELGVECSYADTPGRPDSGQDQPQPKEARPAWTLNEVGDQILDLSSSVRAVVGEMKQNPSISLQQSFAAALQPVRYRNRRRQAGRPQRTPGPSTFYPNTLATALNGDTPKQDQFSSAASTPDAVDTAVPATVTTMFQAARPLLNMGYAAVLELFEVYVQEIFPILPCVTPELLRNRIAIMFASPPLGRIEASQAGMLPELDLIDIEIAKSVIALALAVQEDDQSVLGRDLPNHLLWNTDTCFREKGLDVEDLVMGCLLALWYTYQRRTTEAWRIAGFTSRACLELGLNRERSVRALSSPSIATPYLKRLYYCARSVDEWASTLAGLPAALDSRYDSFPCPAGCSPGFDTILRLHRVEEDVLLLMSNNLWMTEDIRSNLMDRCIQQILDITREVQMLPSRDRTITPPATQGRGMDDWIAAKCDYIGMLARIQSLATPTTTQRQARSVRELMIVAKTAVDRRAQIENIDRLRRPLQPYLDHVLLFAVCCIVLAAVHDPSTWLEECSVDYNLAITLLRELPSQKLLRDGHLPDLASVVRSTSHQSAVYVQRALVGRGNARLPANMPLDSPSISMLDLINDFFGREMVRGMG